MLTGYGDGLAAGGQHDQAGTAPEEGVEQVGATIQYVLAVVQDQEALPVNQKVDQLVGDPGASGECQLDAGHHPQLHSLIVGNGGQVAEEHPTRKLLYQLVGDLDGQAGLAAAADTGQGHHASR